jgi:hypothetical protein
MTVLNSGCCGAKREKRGGAPYAIVAVLISLPVSSFVQRQCSYIHIRCETFDR